MIATSELVHGLPAPERDLNGQLIPDDVWITRRNAQAMLYLDAGCTVNNAIKLLRWVSPRRGATSPDRSTLFSREDVEKMCKIRHGAAIGAFAAAKVVAFQHTGKPVR